MGGIKNKLNNKLSNKTLSATIVFSAIRDADSEYI